MIFHLDTCQHGSLKDVKFLGLKNATTPLLDVAFRVNAPNKLQKKLKTSLNCRQLILLIDNGEHTGIIIMASLNTSLSSLHFSTTKNGYMQMIRNIDFVASCNDMLSNL